GLAIELVVGDRRGVALTAAGEVFLERARAALAAADEVWSTGANLQAGLAGTVRLGVATETPARLTPTLLTAFGHDRPDVEVTVFESYAGTLMRDLRDGRLDAVLAPAAFASAEVQSVPLGSEPWVALAAAGHRLGEAGPVAASELDGESIVVTGHRDGAGHDRAIADLLTSFGVTTSLRRGGPGPALYAAVDAGDAIALSTPAAAIGHDL